MNLLPDNFMMDVTLSFKKLIAHYKDRLLKESDAITNNYLQSILAFVEKHPELEHGIQLQNFEQKEEIIKTLLSDVFPTALTLNEIKAATIPFSDFLFNKSQRFQNILNDANATEQFSILDHSDFDYFKMACGVILNQCYGYSIDLSRPMHCKIPDATGVLKTYRVTYNADFVEVFLKDLKHELSESTIKQLLREPENLELWYEKFPPQSYSFVGFGIISLTDVTVDNAISDLKTILMSNVVDKIEQHDTITNIFRQILRLPALEVGFTVFNHEDGLFETMVHGDSSSFLLGDENEKHCDLALCEDSYELLLKSFEPLVIPDVSYYKSQIHNTFLTDNLEKKGINSAVFYPIEHHNKLLGVLEIVSENAYEINSFNAKKLDSISDYLKAALIRSNQEYSNSVKALIQTECTSIHPSVQWKFEQEARRLLRSKLLNIDDSFTDLKFKDVHPLFGQIDIVGSSDARNQAVQNDLVSQLDRVYDIFAFAKAQEPLPIYDQMNHRITAYKNQLLEDGVTANTENEITSILKNEVNPLMKHIKGLTKNLQEKVQEYQLDLNEDYDVIYLNRDNYDKTVQVVNEKLARLIDKKQKDAQQIYPHFFERFKTDGVEHNMYMGNSITALDTFDQVYLSNLRLWQLQTMIEMEQQFYIYQQDLPVKIKAASMILVFGNTLSVRYRVDEKRFDVDGAYNARYEVIKKRIDKATIKNTNERITQSGKIAIIYTNETSRKEYLRYISFLQQQQLLTDHIEQLELSDVQGVVGLKAIRIEILYPYKNSIRTLDESYAMH